MMVKIIERCMAWIKKNRILSLVLLAGIVFQVYQKYTPIKTWLARHDYDALREIGLTLYEKEEPCDSPVKKICSYPDPASTVFTMKIPQRLRGDDRLTRYEMRVRLLMMVTADSIRPIKSYKDVRPDDGKSTSYTSPPYGDVYISSARPTEQWDQFLARGLERWGRYTGFPVDYSIVETTVPGTVMYDDLICRSIWKDGQDVTAPDRSAHIDPAVRCDARPQLFFSEKYKLAYVACNKPITVHGERKSPICHVISRVASGAELEYSIDGKYFLDGSWVKYDKRIRDYILQYQIK